MGCETSEPDEGDIGDYLQGMQYYIDGYMEDDPDLIQWHYSEAGWRDDVVAGQMDIETLTPENEHRISVVTWLGIDAFEAGVTAYAVRDLDDGPVVAWGNGVQESSELQYFDTETAAPVEYEITPTKLALIAHLLRYGTPVHDALAPPEDSIHQKPPESPKSRSDWLWKCLEAFGSMNPMYPMMMLDADPDPDIDAGPDPDRDDP